MTTVLIIGAGDIGERIADGLAASGLVRRLVLAGRSSGGDVAAATVSSARDCLVESIRLDASRQDEVAELLSNVAPDLIVHCASLRGPWEMSGRTESGGARHRSRRTRPAAALPAPTRPVGHAGGSRG